MNKRYRSLILFFLFIGLFDLKNAEGQWVHINVEDDVCSFAVIDTNIFAGTIKGVFLSKDNGLNWNLVGVANHTVSSLVVSGPKLFAGTSNGDAGVFLSTNNGSSWTDVNNGLTNKSIFSLNVNGINLFAGTNNGGVFLSTNNGVSWNAINTGLTNKIVYSLAVSGSNLYAGTQGEVFLSTNNGLTWIAINTGLKHSDIHSIIISNTNLFAGTWGGGVFLSTNNGANWISVNNGMTNGDVYSLAFTGTNLFAGTINGVFLSTNDGTSWTAVNTGLEYGIIISLAIINKKLFAGAAGKGIWYRPLSEMITSVDEKNIEIPTGYSLEQNHPNPFSSSTTIQFQLQNPTNVTLKIFNALGVEIKTLINNEEYESGTHSIDFDLRNSQLELHTGIYFYQLITPEFTQTKKMVVLR